MQILLRTITALVFLAIGYFVSTSFIEDEQDSSTPAPSGQSSASKTSSKKTPATKPKPSGPTTTIARLNPTTYQVYLQTQGTVRPHTETELNSVVSGNVSYVSEKLQDGAFFNKGDLLIQLDDADFAADIITAEAALARAEAALAQEKATAAQALRNWQDIGFDEEPNDLVLRKPQLKEANANLAAQKAALDQAVRHLERAKIYAPFNGRTRSKSVGIGESISTNTILAEIYATDSAVVRLPLSFRQLTQIEIDEQGKQLIPVTLTDAISESSQATWQAMIQNVEGELDETSRELNLIAHVEDPFNTKSTQAGLAPLRINQPVKASITGKQIPNAFIINRKHLYGADEILLVENNTIKRKQVNIAWSTPEAIITTDTSLLGKTLATSRLNYAKDGIQVQIEEEPEAPEENSSSKSSNSVTQSSSNNTSSISQ